MARAQARDAEPDDGYVPFLDRFKQWWSGDDDTESGDGIVLVKRDGDTTAPGTGEKSPKAITVSRQRPENDGRLWPDARVEFCRRLWATTEEDDEMVEPGGAAHYAELLQPTALNSTKSGLDLSAGLGGGVRYMVGGQGLWITAMEPNRELVNIGQSLSVKRGLAKRAPVLHYDPETLELPPQKHHAVLLRDRLFRMQSKHKLLEAIRQTLKPGGVLVLTDFAVDDDSSTDEGPLSDWFAQEPEKPVLWTVDAYRDILESMDMVVRTFETDASDYRRMIRAGWARLIDGLQREELSRDFVDIMMREAEYWLSVERALDAGDLIHLHIIASTPREEVKR